MRKTTTFVRIASFANRTKTGRPSATAAGKLAHYCALGREKQHQLEPRGTWYSEKGQQVSHEEVMAWVQQQGKQLAYTHQFVLSARDVQLSAADYCRAMQAGGQLFSEWRLIAHDDTRHSHAHALAFGPAEIRVKGQEFQEWWHKVHVELEATQSRQLAHQQSEQLEMQLRQEIARRQELQMQQEQAEKGHYLGYELEM
jgi:hypothetical protein